MGRLKVGDIVVMMGGGGTLLHAEYAVRDERAVVRLERDVPAEPAAPLELSPASSPWAGRGWPTWRRLFGYTRGGGSRSQ